MNKDNYQSVMDELRTEYLESFEEKFSLLHELFEQKDWAKIEMEFHKMKGTGSTYGAPEVSELCREVERICREKASIDSVVLDQAISLLGLIRDKYLKQQSFHLESHPHFMMMKNL